LITAQEVSVNFEIIKGPLPRIVTDQDKLKRVIVNLLSNAIMYTPRRGKVRIAAEKRQNRLKISIGDSGIGIPKAERPHIFEKFFRGIHAIKTAPDGTGLGLFIVKSFVNAMGGRIFYRSRENQGTTFFFTLPQKLTPKNV
jgi:signal transduction histidine kinase